MSDTPRTDECIHNMTKPYETADVDMAIDLCKELERDLATAQASVNELESRLSREEALSINRDVQADNGMACSDCDFFKLKDRNSGDKVEELQAKVKELESYITKLCDRLADVSKAKGDRIKELTSSLNSYKGKLHASEVIRGELEEQAKGMRCCENCFVCEKDNNTCIECNGFSNWKSKEAR